MPDAIKDAIRHALRYPECHEDVIRQGESQPCDKVAVALRFDPNCPSEPYPVCAYHSRAPMVPLADIARVTPPEGRNPE